MASEETSGEYEHKFVDIPDDLICVVCQFVAREPHQVDCCGKIFCKLCIENVKKRLGKCPNCRGTANSFVDRRSARQIKALKISCKNEEKGCSWVGRLEDYEKHIKECKLEEVTCPNNCGTMVERLNLQHHKLKECPKRLQQCRVCAEKIPFVDMDKHPYLCPSVKISCPNECRTKIMRSQLDAHLSACPKEVVECTYSAAGCEVELLRQDLQKHLVENVNQHLNLAMLTISRLRSEGKKCVDIIQDAEAKLRTPPVTFKMTGFSLKKETGEMWSSPPFYTHKGGYKMRLEVYAQGSSGNEDQVEVYVCLMKGQHDGDLVWPFRGEIKIDLLNQVNNQHHHSVKVPYTEAESVDYNSRVITSERNSTGWGHQKFIAHAKLQSDSAVPKTTYLKDDCLYFCISRATVHSSHKMWLCCTPEPTFQSGIFSE